MKGKQRYTRKINNLNSQSYCRTPLELHSSLPAKHPPNAHISESLQDLTNKVDKLKSVECPQVLTYLSSK
jgi:hypothetical protein